jgi:hypothetical protein
MSRIAVIAAGSGTLAVALGAFGAHALRNALDAAALQIWHTAVGYQFWLRWRCAQASAPVSRWRIANSIAFGVGLSCSATFTPLGARGGSAELRQSAARPHRRLGEPGRRFLAQCKIEK